MMRQRLSAICVAAIVLCGCNHPENNRWSGTPVFVSGATAPAGSDFGDWKKPSVAVYSFPTPVAGPSTAAPPPSFALTSLSDHGQQAAIDGLLKAGAKPDDVRAILSAPLSGAGTPVNNAPILEGQYKRTLVATVSKGLDARPGDRFIRTWVDIRPTNFLFSGYTVLATDTELQNIETVTNATTESLQANAGKSAQAGTTATLPKGTATSSVTDTLGLTGNLSNVYTTSAIINQQYNKLSADITPRELRIYRESERNLDVSGNTLISLTLNFPDFWNGAAKREYYWRVTKFIATKQNSILAPDKITFEASSVESPPHCALKADVALIYEFRRITKGNESYVEGDQEVSIEQETTGTHEIELVPADDVRVPGWRIYAGNGEVQYASDGAPNPSIKPIEFSDYEQARSFAGWLNRNPTWVASRVSHTLGSGGLMTLVAPNDPLKVPTGPFQARRFPDPPPPDTIKDQCDIVLPSR